MNLVCECNLISETDVKNYLKENPNTDVMEVKSALRIGTTCGMCEYDDRLKENLENCFTEK